MEVQVYVEDQPHHPWHSNLLLFTHIHNQLKRKTSGLELINRLTYKYMAQVLSVTWSPVSLLLINNCKSFTTF